MKLLHIDSSALAANSVSRQLTAAIVARWQDSVPGLEVTYRDLDTDPLPHLTNAILGGGDAAAAQAGETALQQFLAADVIVLGVPRYNFGVPSTLKAWIDRVAVAGRTFKYTENGPVGLAGGKKVIVAEASGGEYAGTAIDFVAPYLTQVFKFLGITDVEFIRAERVAYSPEHKAQAIEAALAHAPGAVVEVDAEPRRWEVTVLRENGTGVELYIDAASGEVTRERDARLSRVQSTAPKVTAAEAIGIALGNTPGQIIELDLDTERGAVVWELLVRADAGGRFEIYVDATTGEVLKVERDT